MDEPLPLIPWDNLQDETDDIPNLALYGYGILAATLGLFLVTFCSIFEVGLYVIAPLKTHETYPQLYNIIRVVDDYVMRFWGIYVVAWWWAIISWCGLKMFKHAKGSAS